MSPEPTGDAAAADAPAVRHNPGNARAAVIFGGALLVVLLVLCVVIPNPSDSQCNILRFAMALDAAFLSYFFLGGISLSGKYGRNAVKATGGFVLFLLIQFVFDPFELQAAVADNAPGLIPPSEDVRRAQIHLRQSGAYSGPINGRLTTRTRAALKQIQVNNNIKPSGRLNTQTRLLIHP